MPIWAKVCRQQKETHTHKQASPVPVGHSASGVVSILKWILRTLSMSNMFTVLPDSLHWLYNRCKAPTFNCWIYSTVYPCLSVASIICFDQPSNSNNVLFISSYCSGMEKNNAALCIDVLLQQVSCAVCFGCMFVHQLKMPPLISPKCMCWVGDQGIWAG